MSKTAEQNGIYKWREKLQRRQRVIEGKADVLHEISKHLDGPDVAMRYLDCVETSGPSTRFPFGCEATLVFKVEQRFQAVALMTYPPFTPQGLSFVTFEDKRRSLWPAFCIEGRRNPVVSREPVVPFTYNVSQKLRSPAHHAIRWFAMLGQTRVVCEADIATDEARFDLEHDDDMAHNAVLWRWQRNIHFPQGRISKGYGHRWDATKGGENGARVEMYWPFKSLPDDYANFNISYAENLYRIGLVCLYGPDKAEGMVNIT